MLYLDGIWGLQGWQWMFLLQGLPSVILGVVTWFYLTEHPRQAGWLLGDEREWLAGRIDAEHRQRENELSISVLQTLSNAKGVGAGAVAFFIAALIFGVGFFLPQIIKGFGLSNMQTGLVTIIPYAVCAAAMMWYGHHSDRTLERKGHLMLAL